MGKTGPTTALLYKTSRKKYIFSPVDKLMYTCSGLKLFVLKVGSQNYFFLYRFWK